jgi:hypothetical protein
MLSFFYLNLSKKTCFSAFHSLSYQFQVFGFWRNNTARRYLVRLVLQVAPCSLNCVHWETFWFKPSHHCWLQLRSICFMYYCSLYRFFPTSKPSLNLLFNWNEMSFSFYHEKTIVWGVFLRMCNTGRNHTCILWP